MKKIIATAMASVLFSPLAMAETTLYGYADVSFDHFDDGRVTGNQLSSNSSYLGVRGVLPTPYGLNILYQMESLVEVASTPGTGNTLGTRDSYAGLGSKTWGALKYGKSDTPYKKSTGRLDPFSNTVGDYNAIMGNTGGGNGVEFNIRQPDSIWYESPKFAGLNFSVLYHPNENHPSDAGATTGASGVWSADVEYNTGPIFLTGAYERHQDTDRTSDRLGIASESAWKVGGSFTFANINTVSAIYERLSRNGTASERDRKGWYVSDVQKLQGGNELEAAYAKADASDAGNDGARMWAIGGRHHLNKFASVYIVYARDNNDVRGDYGLGQSGHGKTVLPFVAGDKVKALSVGTTLKF